MNNSQLINQDSGNVEYYTDPKFTSAARELMGSIDLDPFSHPVANLFVGATNIFTKEDNGLKQQWYGNVWMNHPFSRGELACKPKCVKKKCKDRGHCIDTDKPSNEEYIDYAINQYANFNVKQLMCITFANTSEAWAQKLLAFPTCFCSPRSHYIQADGMPQRGAPKGSMITYMGDRELDFEIIFEKFGVIKR